MMRYIHIPHIEILFIHDGDLNLDPQQVDHVMFHVLNLKLYMSGVLFRFVSPKITGDVLMQERTSYVLPSYRLQSPAQYHSR
jgi:hypothetical protein